MTSPLEFSERIEEFRADITVARVRQAINGVIGAAIASDVDCSFHPAIMEGPAS
jgi:hypothetical protein